MFELLGKLPRFISIASLRAYKFYHDSHITNCMGIFSVLRNLLLYTFDLL